MQTKNKREFINNITIKLAKYEKERQKRIATISAKVVITLVIAYFSIKLGLSFATSNYDWLLFLFVFIGIACIVFCAGAFPVGNKDFKTYLKNKCKKQILEAFNLSSLSGDSFSITILKNSNLFSSFNRSSYDDVIEGQYKGVDYTIAECELISKGSKSAVTIFKGILVSFTSNKEIKAETLIAPKGDTNIRNYPPNNKYSLIIFVLVAVWMPLLILFITIKDILFNDNIVDKSESFNFMMHLFNASGLSFHFIMPLIGCIIVLIFFLYQKKKMQDVKLEDSEFNKRFDVYTKDQIEARYLLTPSFMERLKSLETAFGTKGIKCSFFNGRIMFAIPTNKDLFELGSLFKPLSSNKQIEQFYDELSSIQEMIEHFKLDEKTGL